MIEWGYKSAIRNLDTTDDYLILRSDRFAAGETTPGTNCIGSWVVPRVCLQETEPSSSVVQLIS